MTTPSTALADQRPPTPRPGARPVVVTLANGKGGSNKTFGAVNLAAELARRGNRVLLIDLDPQGDATKSLVPAEMVWPGSTDQVLTGQAGLLDSLMPTAMPTLWVLPADTELRGHDYQLLTGRPDDYHTILRTLLEAEASGFDYVILDPPGNLDAFTIMALCASAGYIAPMRPEFYYLDGVKEMTEAAQNLRLNGLAPNLTLLGILVSPYNPRRRSGLHRKVLAAVEELYPQLTLPYVGEDQDLGLAPIERIPLQVSDPGATGVKDFQALTDQVLAKYRLLQPTPSRRPR